MKLSRLILFSLILSATVVHSLASIAQKGEFVQVIFRIQQGATFGSAGLMVKPEIRALIAHIDRTSPQPLEQARNHGTKGAPFQPRAMRQRDHCLLGRCGR